MPASEPRLARRAAMGMLALTLAAALWLTVLHLLFEPHDKAGAGIPAQATELAERHLRIWTDQALLDQELARMRSTNAEWDFMGRSFLVWSLANMSLREPSGRARWLAVMDRIIAETLRLERERGMFHFLMPYARAREYVQQPPRSVFLDGEIALMVGLRRLVEDRDDYRAILAERVETMAIRMGKGPVVSAESYPDECWVFCNTVALASMAVADALDGTDHSELMRAWVTSARAHLIDSRTGLLVSSYTMNGKPLDGPEGSSIWMAAHDLLLIDEAFARDQYARARRALAVNVLGFAYAREWPDSRRGRADVDSGPIIPILEASAGSSGLALLGASAFGDGEFLKGLRASLELAGFPVRSHGMLRYAASNQVGDAVALYALVQGPAWDAIRSRRHL